MVTFLARKFIPNYTAYQDRLVREKYGSLCSILGIVWNLLLFTGKYVAGTLSGSIAILADAMNSLSDAGSSIITLVGFKCAGKKADSDHPFGHGRVEYISGLIVSFLVLLMGVELFKDSIGKIMHPEMITSSSLVIGILIVSILVKCYMAYYNRAIGNKIQSAAMRATSTDSFSDAVSTGVVLGCTILAKIAGINLDGWCGLFVAGLVVYAGIGAVKETMDPLLGQPPTAEFVKSIYDIVLAKEGILGMHDLVVHDYGPGRVMISLHAEVPGDGDMFAVHDTIDLLERELNEQLGCEATIHMDPIAVGDERTDQLKKVVVREIKKLDERLSIHDFRVVPGVTHTNLVFDILVPAGYEKDRDGLITQLQEAVQQTDATLFLAVKVDEDYSTR
ncbi:cation diffusion facilitator family transporter [Lachnospiraceae bacterium XBB1006]|nr:cation diffusion facilitator family transporter [Lachnospiraceae bacterium XBB1006]